MARRPISPMPIAFSSLATVLALAACGGSPSPGPGGGAEPPAGSPPPFAEPSPEPMDTAPPGEPMPASPEETPPTLGPPPAPGEEPGPAPTPEGSLSPDAGTQPSAGTSASASAAPVPQAKIDAYVAAASDLEQLHATYAPKLRTISSRQEAEALRAEIETAAKQKIREHGFTVEDFKQIGERAKHDDELRQRLIDKAQRSAAEDQVGPPPGPSPSPPADARPRLGPSPSGPTP